MRRYNPKVIEPKWQVIWDKSKIYQAEEDKTKPKRYVLEYFPYPSGAAMHVGHVRNYTIGDVISRVSRMQGNNVLHPMGWDAFGLPAENYAIKTRISPQEAVAENIKNFRQQLMQMGFSYDWSREVNSTDPKYYKWTQWLFLLLFNEGLAYQKEALVNWDPVDKTVLANEQVIDGKAERSGALVEKKALKQWFFKITAYAERLEKDLDKINWSNALKTMQRNWIGHSKGAEISWQVTDSKGNEEGHEIKTFTTRTDTIPGVTFIVVAPESALLDDFTTPEHIARVHSYRREAESLTDLQRLEDKSKTGVFTGKYAKNPFNGEIVPIYAANYILGGYGTGVVMGMGGHDLRDREFSLEHGIKVILTTEVPEEYQDLTKTKIWAGSGRQINSGEKYDGLDNKKAGELIFKELIKAGSATEQVNYKIRDWLISRQRYWGAPIPIIHCPKHGAVPVPEDDLPVELPPMKSYEPSGDGRSPLARISEFVNTKCPICGGPAERETDTMDGFACSSWYFLRFADPHNDKKAFDKSKVDYWLPVDDYIGGAEHAVMHLLYARFWTKVLYDKKMIDFDEPFSTLRNHGMILAPDGQKMSKSKNNTIEPDDLIEQGYGADSIRLMELFIGPWNQAANWSIEGIAGMYRFLQRFWTLVMEFLETTEGTAVHNAELETSITRTVHNATKKVTADLEVLGFNTAIAAMMGAINELYKVKSDKNFALASNTWRQNLSVMVQLVAPFAPHFAEELWAELGHETSVHVANWPLWDEELVKEEMMTLAIQINGKVRAEIVVETDVTEATAVEAAKAEPRVAELLKGQKIHKTIYVPGRLISLVTK